MSIDAKHVFSDQQSGAGSSGDTIASSNVIDLGDGKAGLQPMAAVATVQTAFSGSGKLQAVLQDSANNSDYADVLAGPVIDGAVLAKGKKLFNAGLPADLRRYIRMAFKITSASLSAGKIDAVLEPTPQSAMLTL